MNKPKMPQTPEDWELLTGCVRTLAEKVKLQTVASSLTVALQDAERDMRQRIAALPVMSPEARREVILEVMEAHWYPVAERVAELVSYSGANDSEPRRHAATYLYQIAGLE